MDQVGIIYNARSGALLAEADSVEERLRDLFAGRGVKADLRAFDPDMVAADVRSLLAAGPDALIVAGGDGTIRTVAAQLSGVDVPLGILPAGTMNVLARDLGIPNDLDEATDVLLAGEVREIDVAMVNGDLFLCSSTLAIMPHLGQLREQARDGIGWRVVRLVGKAIRILWRYPRMRLSVVVDGTEHAVRTRAMVVSSNPLTTAPVRMPSRERLDTGVLAVYIAQDRTNWDLLAVTAKLFDGSWQQDARLRKLEGRTVEVRTDQLGGMSVMSDGETAQLSTPIRYEIRPRALAVLAGPPDKTPEDT
ncbi:diacylglycerol/lipid kinase family protein [Flindersiella endophytica]